MLKIKIFHTLLLVIVLFASCYKNNNTIDIPAATKPIITGIDSTAMYKMTIEGIWQSPQHTIPVGNHFTNFIGMMHDNTTASFKVGEHATLGIENIAEVGNATELIKEINISIAAGKAAGLFNLTLPNIMGTATTALNVSTKHSLISFASMIAPSADWFVGLQNYNLIQNGNWVNDVTVNAFGYDAGTEEGDVFGYNNPATAPQQNISYLTSANASVIANGNATVAAFVKVRFVKQ